MSDQDFFFDDEETPAEAKEPKKAEPEASKPQARGRASGKHTSAAAGPPTVTMTVAGLIGVIALLIGVIIGVVIPTGASTPISPAGMPAGMGDGEARPLSPEEMQSGQMPPDHPDISEMLGETETGTPDPDAEPAPEGEEEPASEGDSE